MFEHAWLIDHIEPHKCSKCQQDILNNSYFYTYEKPDEFMFCDLCYSILLGDIHKLVLEFVGKYEESMGIITNDQVIRMLLDNGKISLEDIRKNGCKDTSK